MYPSSRILQVFTASCIAWGGCTSGDGSGAGSGGSTGPGDIGSRTSGLCSDVTGMEALAWDYYNGVIVVDPILPPPVPVGRSYSHTDFPLLGFSHAAGWTPFEIQELGVEGVNLIRDDNRAIWRYVSVLAQGAPDVRAVRDAEIDAMRQFFGLNDPVETVCLNEGSAPQAGGVAVANFSNILIRSSGHAALVATSVTVFQGVSQAGIAVRAISAPAEEFPDRLWDSFMAIDWQLLIGDSTNDLDRDRDGWLNDFDRFPDDPNRH